MLIKHLFPTFPSLAYFCIGGCHVKNWAKLNKLVQVNQSEWGYRQTYLHVRIRYLKLH